MTITNERWLVKAKAWNWEWPEDDNSWPGLVVAVKGPAQTPGKGWDIKKGRIPVGSARRRTLAGRVARGAHKPGYLR